jgi:CheY-like chemotaxis protein
MILLIEDDPADARLIQRALGKLGLTDVVTRLNNGEDAVSYLRGDEPFENRRSYPLPSLILLDIKLPRRNGFEVLQWLRKQADVLRRTPVVMLTSSRHAVDVNRAYDLGANSYLVKPESYDQLAELGRRIKEYWMGTNENPLPAATLPEV